MRFWSAVYILCAGTGLNFFKGSKLTNQVVLKKSQRGLYSPKDGCINFAIPNERYLRKVNQNLPKVIPPGIIPHSLNTLKGKKNYVLMADGKGVARGFRGKHEGDVNLWGHEGPPSLGQMDDKLSSHIEYIEQMRNSEDISYDQRHSELLQLMKLITLEIQSVRNQQLEEKRRLHSMEKGFQSNMNKYKRGIIAKKVYLYRSQIWVMKALHVNRDICKLLASYAENLHLYTEESHIKLCE